MNKLNVDKKQIVGFDKCLENTISLLMDGMLKDNHKFSYSKFRDYIWGER